MRYRGGGIGHKYMRAIEELYENMSRERTHHEERKRAPSDQDAMDMDGESASDDEHISTTNERGASGGEGGEGENTSWEDEEVEDEDDESYVPRSDSNSSEAGDSDDLASEDDYQGESYGFGDF